jgi:hypothetical protein
MTTATLRDDAPEIVHEPAPAGPLLPVGLPVKVDRYAGVLPADDDLPARCRILSLRLAAEVAEDWVEPGPDEDEGHNRDVVTYPAGWEYLVVRDRRLSDAWGWVSEAELIEKGYGSAR